MSKWTTNKKVKNWNRLRSCSLTQIRMTEMRQKVEPQTWNNYKTVFCWGRIRYRPIQISRCQLCSTRPSAARHVTKPQTVIHMPRLLTFRRYHHRQTLNSSTVAWPKTNRHRLLHSWFKTIVSVFSPHSKTLTSRRGSGMSPRGSSHHNGRASSSFSKTRPLF